MVECFEQHSAPLGTHSITNYTQVTPLLTVLQQPNIFGKQQFINKTHRWNWPSVVGVCVITHIFLKQLSANI